MKSLGYQSCKADPDLWLKLETRPEDGVKHYTYLNDILCIHHSADSMLKWLYKSFPLKMGFGKPDMYLGAKLHKTRLHNNVWKWAMSPIKYIQEAARNCAVHLAASYDDRFRLLRRPRIHLRWVMI